ncbi:uncharacterized protein LOC115331643 [Ixodes scapularis]|uniref:uncharacterized protein LOC115331643 n=1 Tax=Ixodes scapularis TaxID=6945 RepID=UPI001A9DF960|nr:uncharacterized protein LOC115331643 [Ixodes scapularis]
MRPGLRRSDVDVSPPNVSTVMCDASERFYFLAETLFRQQVTRCLREASKCSYSPLRRAERAAELWKADLPQRWHPENRAMALAKNPPAAGRIHRLPGSEDMLQAPCNALGACATSRGSAFHGPVTSWEVLHRGDDILSSTSFTVWDQVHEGVALQAHERRALQL